MIIDKKSAIGDILPNARISKIILESSAGPEKKIYPHIDHPSETKKYDTGSTPEQMMVTVDIVIKDTIGKKGLSSWFSNLDFSKYLKVGLVQSRDNGPYGTQSIAEGIGRPPSHSRNFIKKVIESKAFPAGGLTQDDIKSIAVRDILVAPDTPDIKKQYKFVDSNGNTYYEFHKRVQFQFNTTEPEHLVYFVFSYIDIGELENDFPDLDTEVFGQVTFTPYEKVSANFMGAVEVCQVFTNSSLNMGARIYVTQNNEIWTGPVHAMQNGTVMTGASHSPDSQVLSSKSVPNIKIQDFRARNKLFDTIPSLIKDTKKFYSSKTDIKIVASEDIDKQDVSSYFSDLFLSRDYLGRARGFFSVNYEDILRDMSKFGAILAQENFIFNPSKKVRDLSQVMSLKITRRQLVDGKPREDEVEHIVAKGAEGPAGGFLSATDFALQTNEITADSLNHPIGSNDVKSEYKGNVRPAASDMSLQINDGLKHYDMTDYAVQHEGDGQYQYGVEMEVYDGSYAYMRELSHKLRKAVEDLRPYYQASLTPGVYNADAGKFTQQFAAVWAPIVGQKLPDIIANFFEAYSVLASKSFDHVGLATKLNIYANTASGSPDGISILLGIISDLTITYEKLTGIKAMLKSGAGAAPEQSVHGTSPQRTIKLKYTFPNLFQSYDDNVGYDVVGLNIEAQDTEDQKASSVGLREYTLNDMTARANMETISLFKEVNATFGLISDEATLVPEDNLDETKFTYYTPKVVNLGHNKKIGLVPEAGMQEQTFLDIVSIVKDLPETPQFIEDEKLKMKNTLVRVLSDQNCTIADKSIISNLNFSFSQAFIKKLEETEPSLGGFNTFNIAPHVVSDGFLESEDSSDPGVKKIDPNSLFLYLLQDEFFASKRNRKVSYDLTNNVNEFRGLSEGNDMAATLRRSRTFKELPNQIKYMFLAQNNDPSGVAKSYFNGNPLSHNQVAKYFFHNQNIFKIDVLKQYERSNNDERTFVKSAVYTPLTQGFLAASGGRRLICRISRYEGPASVPFDDRLDLPVYHEHFIISVPSTGLESLDAPVFSPASIETVVQSIKNTVASIPQEIPPEIIDAQDIEVLINSNVGTSAATSYAGAPGATSTPTSFSPVSSPASASPASSGGGRGTY